MPRNLITDPPPCLDATMPEAENAVLAIALELEVVREELPELTPRQQLQEARRRSAKAMVAAVEAAEARATRKLLGEALQIDTPTPLSAA